MSETRKYACYITYNYHRKSNIERLKSLLDKREKSEYPIVLLCGPDGSGRDFFVNSVAFQQSKNDKPTEVLTLDYDGFNQTSSNLRTFIDYQIENNPEFQESKTRKLLESIKSEFFFKAGSDLIPFFTFGVKVGLSVKDLKAIIHSTAPEPQRSEREYILRLIDRTTEKRQVIIHLKNALVNCSDAVGLLIQESFRRKAMIAISCESEEEFQHFFPKTSCETLSFSNYDRSELHEVINRKYQPNKFDLNFIDLLFQYTKGIPELLAAKMEDLDAQRMIRVDNKERYFLADEATSEKVIDLFPDIFEPYEKIQGENKDILDELLRCACLCGRYFPLKLLISFMNLDGITSNTLQELIDNKLTKCKPLSLLKDFGYNHPCFFIQRQDVNIYSFDPRFREYMLCRMTETEKKEKATNIINFLEIKLPIRTRAIARIFIELANFSQIDRKIKKYNNYLIFWVRIENANQLKQRVIQELKDHKLDPEGLFLIIKESENWLYPIIRLNLLEAYETNPSGLPWDRQSSIMYLKGTLYCNLAKYRKAEPLIKCALEIDERSFGSEHPNVAAELNTLGNIYIAINRFIEAEPLLQRALEIDEKYFGSEHPNVATVLINLSSLYQRTNRLSKAEVIIKRALKIDEKVLGPVHSRIALSINNLALLYLDTGCFEKAEELMLQSLEIDEKVLGPEHPGVATSLNNLAVLYQRTNRLAEAVSLIKRALVIDEVSIGPEHPDFATSLSTLAQLYQKTQRFKKAESLMKRILEIDKKSFGLEHHRVARDLNNLGLLYKLTNRLEEAEPLLQLAVEICEKSLGSEHPDLATDLNNLALLYQATNRLSEAKPLMKRSLVILLKFTRRTGRQHPDLISQVNNYSKLLMRMGHNKEEVDERLKRLAPEIFGEQFWTKNTRRYTKNGNWEIEIFY